ncbi:putative CCR4-associated factor 1-like protein 11 [Hibiscus syriacus]|uniref:CCR4-associated factor 1-like protein 11 n=1 Tax=Hibiscus syriacus TaxID=106335 RepID=A0A6A3BB24_HIBSY|nr:putative CCR4-associated factor 1-like protein 11 [Hibiscus syriacus]
MSDKPPLRKSVVIRSVWSHTLESEFEIIRSVVDNFPIISMDTEFPGVVVRPNSLGSVDLLKMIQLGLTLSDCNGNLPDLGTENQFIREFNFRDFDIANDAHAHDSVEILRRQGIDFEKNRDRLDPIRGTDDVIGTRFERRRYVGDFSLRVRFRIHREVLDERVVTVQTHRLLEPRALALRNQTLRRQTLDEVLRWLVRGARPSI